MSGVDQPRRIITERDANEIHALAKALGQDARCPAFATFMELDEASMLVATLCLTLEAQPVKLGAIVVTTRPNGSQLVSVRGPKNQVIPGAGYYSSVSDALSANKRYFEFLAKKTRERFNPTLADRLRRVFD